MAESHQCCGCGSSVRGAVRFGLCPRCLLDSLTTGTGAFVGTLSSQLIEELRNDCCVGAGRFRLLRRLGEGGMGQVWLAEDSRLDNKPVALKFVRPRWGRDPRLINELRLELSRTRDLHDRNIVKVHDWHDHDDELPFLSMEFVDGPSLATVLHEFPEGLEYRRLHPLLLDVCRALTHAHEQGILHRDIKPGNILVSASKDREIAKLSDFGIAQLLESDEVTSERPRGTKPYMSLEQARGASAGPVDDIFSWGVTVYQLLTGKLPFGSDGCLANPALQPLPGAFDSPARLNGVPQPVRALVVGCLELTAAARPRHFGAIRDVLEQCPPPEKIIVPPPRPRTSEDRPGTTVDEEKPPSPAWVRPTLIGVAVVLLLVLGWSRRESTPLVMRDLRNWLKGPSSRWDVRPQDITDVPAFATLLAKGERKIDGFVVRQLSVTTRRLLQSPEVAGTNAAEFRRSLAQDLTVLVGGRSIYEPNRFAGIDLETTIEGLLGKRPSQTQLDRANRWLLESAYPRALDRRERPNPEPTPDTNAPARLDLTIHSIPGPVEVALYDPEGHPVREERFALPLPISTRTFVDLPPRRYGIRLTQEDHDFFQTSVVLEPGKTTEVTARPRPHEGFVVLELKDPRGGLGDAAFRLWNVANSNRMVTGRTREGRATLKAWVGMNKIAIGSPPEEILQTTQFVTLRDRTNYIRHTISRARLGITAPSQQGRHLSARVFWTEGGERHETTIPGPDFLEMPIGDYQLAIRAPGHVPDRRRVYVRNTKWPQRIVADLRPCLPAIPDHRFTNSLAMGFAPLATPGPGTSKLWMACTEITLGQFKFFADTVQDSFQGMKCLTPAGLTDCPDRSFRDPGFPVDEEHPVVGVSWNDANRFCAWLTEVERQQGILRTNQFYRLPKGAEWQQAALQRGPAPPNGNFAGPEVLDLDSCPDNQPHGKAVDAYPGTAPVGVSDGGPVDFDVVNLFDNVQEWCDDRYVPDPDGANPPVLDGYPSRSQRPVPGQPISYRVVCGGSWYDSDKRLWEPSARRCAPEGERTSFRGFRVVLAEMNPKPSP